MEQEVLKLTQSLGVGAQFGGKYFCHDVRVIRLPRHGASLPIGLGVSCSADRQAMGKITRDGVYLEQLESNPAQYMPDVATDKLGGEVVKIDLNKPMKEILAQLTRYPIKTRLSLIGPDDRGARSGARQAARAAGEGAGAARLFQEPSGVLRGSGQDAGGLRLRRVRPDHGGADGFLRRGFPEGRRLDGDAGEGQPLAAVREACKQYGGFYLASIGGAAANLAEHCIKKVETVEYPELGMEAIWRIEVVDFPAFIVVDDKGNDFFKELNLG